MARRGSLVLATAADAKGNANGKEISDKTFERQAHPNESKG
jgi:hypothetical protein